MSTTETQTFTTPSGHTVEHIAYLNRRETRRINAVYYEQIDEVDVEKRNVKGISHETLEKLEDREIQAVVRAVTEAGSEQRIEGKDEILDIVLEWPMEDFNALMEKVNEVTGKKKQLQSLMPSHTTSQQDSSPAS